MKFPLGVLFLSVMLLVAGLACTRHTSAPEGEGLGPSLAKTAASGPEASETSTKAKIVERRENALKQQNPPGNAQTVVLAGGCFWGMQEILRQVPGILKTEVGYAGGTTPRPQYEDVRTGRTGHAESVRIVFDPARLSFADLLEKWFFRMHDPTTKNRQGNDIGTQYRSAIFVTTSEQRELAEAVKKRVDASGKWNSPVVTEIADAGPFTPAEDYHQAYLQKNPGGYTCHYLRD
jgi:methionine-S-sulfoxide reductase